MNEKIQIEVGTRTVEGLQLGYFLGLQIGENLYLITKCDKAIAEASYIEDKQEAEDLKDLLEAKLKEKGGEE